MAAVTRTRGLARGSSTWIGGAALALLCGAAAQAAPVYTATVDTCGAAVTATGSTTQFVSTSSANCGGAYYGSGSAQSSPYGIGANLELWSNFYSGSDHFTATATVQTEFMITGAPGTTVTASLNLDLTSGIGGGIPGGAGSISTRDLRFRVAVPGLTHESFIHQVADPASGLVTTSSVGLQGICSPCSVETLDFTVSANAWHSMTLSITLDLSGGGYSYGQITALDTLYFPLVGAVFNLPEGYSARIAGLNVENNRVVGIDGTVPEPGALALLGLGLAGLAAARRRGRRAAAPGGRHG